MLSRQHQAQRGFTLIELLVVIAVIAVLASIMFPVFAKAQSKAKQTNCLSNVRQLGVATLMFVQDNRGVLPDAGTWAADLDEYVGNRKLYTCPLDASGDGYVSYGLSGLLVNADGTGLIASAVRNPSEVGLFADATSKKYPDAPVMNYGGMGGIEFVQRHSMCVSYMDGHSEPLGGKKQFDLSNPDSPIARSFYQASGFGWVVNPGGGVMRPSATPTSGTIKVGGSTTCTPVFEAAMAGWTAAGGSKLSAYYEGSGAWATNTKSGRPWDVNDVGGASAAQTGLNADGDIIATDAMGIIVSSASKLAVTSIAQTDIVGIFGLAATATTQKTALGVTDGNVTVNVYTRDIESGTRQFICRTIMAQTGATKDSVAVNCIEVKSAQEMIAKVGADSYGIGYAGLGQADPNKVKVLDFKTTTGTVQTYTRKNVEDGKWALVRPLFGGINASGPNAAAAHVVAFVTYLKSDAFRQSILFKSDFFLPKAHVTDYPTTF